MRRGLTALLLAVFGVLLLTFTATPASAAPVDDVIDSFQIGYQVTPDGVLQVKETIVYRFGQSSGRHGMYRDLVIREKWADDDSKDQRYDVSNVRVSSPSGHSDEFTEEVFKTNGHRNQSLRLKIGSADRTIIDATATYVIQYDVRGALRHFDDHSELYWDATGADWKATIKTVTVSAQVPEGVTRVECFTGPPRSTQQCQQKSVQAGKGTFIQTNIEPGDQLTVVAGIKAGVVSNDTPIVVDPPGPLERVGLSLWALLASLVTTAIAVTAGVMYHKRGFRDERFAGMPPGAFPPAGAVAPAVVKDDLDEDQIPVAFAPPPIAVGEAGLLIDSVANTTETAATLIDMAVRGGVRIENHGTEQRAVLLDPAVATRHHEQVLLQSLFPGLQPGTALTLERRPTGDNSMRQAHDVMIAALRGQITQYNWYIKQPRGAAMSGASAVRCGCLAIVIFFAAIFGLGGAVAAASAGGAGPATAVALPLLGGIVALVLYFSKKGKGKKNATGRAIADQLVGFRTYLATAEADQLRFEEGEDIFSKYLPWAIAFGIADRWQAICAQLVAAGRIPPDPYWYYGPSYYTSGYSAHDLERTVASTFDLPPPPANSGGGGGSSSGFSGGSSGGGGGGGGGGSW
ncbi:DUF2207 domain-containing protein [Kribbella sp. NBC_01245]|uniref:DUF2207 domain-containing protein n=1 Tax=Kribbella sp. NBC_01245 TaxID=2903578 RepID=UPI002E2D36A0|nr:DUF2207 domain-containing protein [Kribbella sp. NBC_01245]